MGKHVRGGRRHRRRQKNVDQKITPPTHMKRWEKKLLRKKSHIIEKMLFCEHGTAPDKNIIKWQNRINPIWGKLFGGCNINRDIPNILKESGFKINTLDQMYLPSTPKIVGYNYWGEATR